jgi:hypothetical protein
LAMDTGTRAFDSSFGNLTGGDTEDQFKHFLSAHSAYALAMLLAKLPRSLFVLPMPCALTAHCVRRLK